MFPRFILATALPMLAAISGDAPRPAYAASGLDAGADDASAFVKLEKVEIPIFGDSRIEGRINANLVLQMASPEEAAVVARRMPELRAHIVESMLEYGSLYVSGFAPVDAEGLSAALNRSVKTHGKGVRRVLIVELSASPV